MKKKVVVSIILFIFLMIVILFMYSYFRHDNKSSINNKNVYVKNKPTELSNDFSSFIIELDNDMYQMPICVSELIENGWKIEEKYIDISVDPNDLWNVTFTKNIYAITLSAKNYSEKVRSINECYITTIDIMKESNVPIIQLPYGIQLGMKREKFENVINRMKYDEEKHYNEIYYTFNLRTKDILQYIDITVDNEKDEITEILIYCDPFWAKSRKK
ncbi:hypothetical protein [Anaeromicropila herbilytica]|uniref:Uncharacterized protein n=1 Tax=Anaeromicropila herbilytica TaxID=2785025 RepID=A0A7R7ENN8_9FIRM|nr:hypothetical protein [Anaeromicropila herbilytica]BCN32084.1 hypothetical protein bsdtb5_33790 [Anaeromicropila herbilytica]